MNTLSDYNIILLKFINGHSSLNNDYALERFYAKSENPSHVFVALKELRNENLIEAVDAKAQVKSYYLTKKGIETLKQEYNLKNLKSSVNKIEETGFFLKIMELIQASEAKDSQKEIL